MPRQRKVRAQVRSTQLITPFSSGSIYSTPGGVSVIVSSPSLWNYGGEEEKHAVVDTRLADFLNVDSFRSPPDTTWGFRFPRWHFCNRCGFMKEMGMREHVVRSSCPREECEGEMVQVRFVAACERGHLRDVDWVRWVHRGNICSDNPRLKWSAQGQPYVKCEGCGKYRPVQDLFREKPDPEKLPGYMKCGGEMPWLGGRREECDRVVIHTLRNATNVCFPVVRSSINLSGASDERLRVLVDAIKRNPLVSALGEDDLRKMLSNVRKQLAPFLEKSHLKATDFLDEDVIRAHRIARGEETTPWREAHDDREFRQMEYELLTGSDLSLPGLEIRQVNITKIEPKIAGFFSQIVRVEKLIETRALVGFTRVRPEYEHGNELKKLLWGTEAPPWLPAIQVHGEGIFIAFSMERIEIWKREHAGFIGRRIDILDENRRTSSLTAPTEEGTIGIFDIDLNAEFVLIHTFAHLLINQLVRECGYSSASLRERLYVGDNMIGVLIYTASGDSEGTLGGLVSMATPGRFEPVVRRAIAEASWCSVDPVCTELGNKGGQGPGNCNLAACYACAMVPETACEHMNRWLDRGIVVGNPDNREAGYFSGLIG